jgi:hypothetical protein
VAIKKENTDLDRLMLFIGLILLITIIGLCIFIPSPTAFQCYVFRVVVALSASMISIGIPGALQVQIGSKVKAGSALGVFLVVYGINPPALLHLP